MSYLAHSGGHLLTDHLQTVAHLAGEFAGAFDAAEEARLAGLLHDLGKYGDLFQARLQGKARGIDHWSAGAWAALERYRAVAVAAAVQGHHIGLQQIEKNALRALEPARLAAQHPLGLRLSEADPEVLWRRLEEDGIQAPESLERSAYGKSIRPTASAMLDVRMLFSALVDADWLDTGAHFAGEPVGAHPPVALQPERALEILLDHLSSLAASSTAAQGLREIRRELAEACLKAAEEPPGLWTLSAPTGAGKTLAMLAFGLRHAAVHGLRRLITVIPYLSIIEQTAAIYRRLLEPHFGRGYVCEHHSLTGTREEPKPAPGRERDGDTEAFRREALLADNWEAPLVVTTSVQFLESLFSNRPSACRKLHRLARSVILFDEVQTIPDHLAVPTLATLSWLAKRYHSTVVFATATQPAFSHLDRPVRALGEVGWAPREIAPRRLQLFVRARRAHVNWPDPDQATSWEELAAEVAATPQILCIVNLKRHARELMQQLLGRAVDGVFHLSTAMCPAHRQAVLRLVRRRLRRGLSCRLVSTQCVEAGVDIDFPVVYRAMGPLEAIAQAAGRCNREGRLARGEVTIFRPEDEGYPPGAYRQASDVTKMLLQSKGPAGMDITSPALFEEYYRTFYQLARPEQKRPELLEAIRRQDFAEVARRYRLIERDSINVLVPYKRAVYQRLAEQVHARGLTAAWIRRARPYTVGIYRPRRGAEEDAVWAWLEPAPVARGAQSDEWFIYTNEEGYNRSLGLMPDDAPSVWLV